jgi:hypothetical protein
MLSSTFLGEALSFDFEGKVLNPFGVDIDLPFSVFARLKKLHPMERDGPMGKMRIPANACLGERDSMCNLKYRWLGRFHGTSALHGQSQRFWGIGVAVSC